VRSNALSPLTRFNIPLPPKYNKCMKLGCSKYWTSTWKIVLKLLKINWITWIIMYVHREPLFVLRRVVSEQSRAEQSRADN
jgi:hypothetical protein